VTVAVAVLLIDDEDQARAALADRLRRFRRLELIDAVRDEREAAGALSKAEPDVLLVDLHSRHGEDDGVQLCSELHRMASAPLVVLTSFMTDERWQRLRAAGATNCLLKHVDSGHLERELVLVGTKYRSEAVASEEGRDEALRSSDL